MVCPSALKGVLSATEAARALAAGFGRAGSRVVRAPVADGGEGTAEVLHASLGGEWRKTVVSDPLGRQIEARFLLLPDGRAVVESAAAIGLRRLAHAELDPLRASSRGLGELIRAALDEDATGLVVGLGDSATVDGGIGMREALRALPVETLVACDVANPLLGERGAARVFGPQKGAGPLEVGELERRLAGVAELAPYASLAGAGAAGGLGAALAALGARLVSGAELVVDTIGLGALLRGVSLAVTGEGTVDGTSLEGKATGLVTSLCLRSDVRCVVFGGVVCAALPGAEVVALSGDPRHARADLEALGERLGGEV